MKQIWVLKKPHETDTAQLQTIQVKLNASLLIPTWTIYIDKPYCPTNTPSNKISLLFLGNTHWFKDLGKTMLTNYSQMVRGNILVQMKTERS